MRSSPTPRPHRDFGRSCLAQSRARGGDRVNRALQRDHASRLAANPGNWHSDGAGWPAPHDPTDGSSRGHTTWRRRNWVDSRRVRAHESPYGIALRHHAYRRDVLWLACRSILISPCGQLPSSAGRRRWTQFLSCGRVDPRQVCGKSQGEPERERSPYSPRGAASTIFLPAARLHRQLAVLSDVVDLGIRPACAYRT
jgi:hypothetical protein